MKRPMDTDDSRDNDLRLAPTKLTATAQQSPTMPQQV